VITQNGYFTFTVLIAFTVLIGCTTIDNLEKPEEPTSTVISIAPATMTPKPINSVTPKATMTVTEVPTFAPIRPVDKSVPIYHCYGVPIEIDDAHNGYDFGFQNSNPIGFPIVAIADGVLLSATFDTSEGGAIFIDHGIVKLPSGTLQRIISTYWHIKPMDQLLGGNIGNQGMRIKEGDQIAAFCNECGYSPELELQIISLDATKTNRLHGSDLRDFMLQQYGLITPGEYPHIDPAEIGLNCQ
jgi:hypothetical protein